MNKMSQLNLMCPFSNTGYGITSYNIYKQLRNNVDITLFPISNVVMDDIDNEIISDDIRKQSSYNPDNPCLKIWHQFDMASRVGKKDFYGFTFFEIDRLNDTEIHMLNQLEGILVASDWAKQILQNNNIHIPISVCPLGIDPDIFNNNVNNLVKKENKYIFINIGKWEIRKGHDILVDIFNMAFNEEDNVELWMLNYNPFLTQEENLAWMSLYKNSKLNKKIKVFPRIPRHEDLAKFIALGDCGIFPARAEGWNNEIPEFMALNKPIIATNYSAHTQYLNTDNSYLIDIESLTPAIDDKFFNGFGNWAKIDDNQIEQAVSHMRYVYTNDIRNNPIGMRDAQKLTWKNTASIIEKTIFNHANTIS
jgi:glycosyltransferase involved in cell wall biosynthesis